MYTGIGSRHPTLPQIPFFNDSKPSLKFYIRKRTLHYTLSYH